MGLKLISIVLFIMLFSVSPVRAEEETVSGISDQLVCQCGCTMVLSNCSHIECGSREAMTALIGQKLDQGQSEQQIIQFFVAEYGEQVLSAPSKRGFNLAAWITPFVVILVGGAVVYIALKKWTRRGRYSPVNTVVEAGDEDYKRQLDKELEEFTERGFR
jgi:cytochrome c-type biogenesis protein CcmH